MKILVIEWNGYGFKDIINAFRSLDHDLFILSFDIKSDYFSNPEFEDKLNNAIKDFHPDFIFTFNYFPLISNVAVEHEIKSVFWVYDSPHYMLYSPSINNHTNYVFLFDRSQYIKLKELGVNTVHYLPLAADAKRLGNLKEDPSFKSSRWYNKSDIAFVGALYNEENRYYPLIAPLLSDHTRGFLEGIISAQSLVYGYNFIEEMIDNKIIEELESKVFLDYYDDSDNENMRNYLYSQCIINREITARERFDLLNEIGKHYHYDLYTNNSALQMNNCTNHGYIDYYEGAPRVYKKAKINLNFTLRSIYSGIPLRAFEILGSGGFLLSNYQSDFEDCYTAFEDYVYFESKSDMMNKIEYYLTREKERTEIAMNGYNKTLANNTFHNRILTITSVITGDMP